MTTTTMEAYISIPLFTSGERHTVFSNVHRVATLKNQPAIAAHCERGLAHERETREYDMRWANRSQRMYTQEVADLDVRIDPVHTSIRDITVAHVRALPPGDPLADRAQAMLDDLYPAGVAGVTKLPYVDQAVANEIVVGKLQTTHAGVVDELGLAGRVQYLAELSQAYSAAIDLGRTLTFAEVNARRARGQQRLRELIALVLGTFADSDDPAQVADRAELLESLALQVRLARQRQRARRRRDGGEGQMFEETPEEGMPEEEIPEEELPEEELPEEMPPVSEAV